MRLLLNNSFNDPRSFYLQYVCLLIICLFSKCEATEVHPDIKWIEESFGKINENTSVEEIADHVVQLKLYVQFLGYQTPSWDEFINIFKEGLGDDSDFFSNEEANRLKAILVNKEIQYALSGYTVNVPQDQLIPYNKCGLKSALGQIFFPFGRKHKHEHHKKTHSVFSKHPEMNGRMSTSVLCAAAGTLCFFIPVPGASAAGVFLLTMAATNVATEIMEISDKNLKDQAEGKINENTKRILDQYGVKYSN